MRPRQTSDAREVECVVNCPPRKTRVCVLGTCTPKLLPVNIFPEPPSVPVTLNTVSFETSVIHTADAVTLIFCAWEKEQVKNAIMNAIILSTDCGFIGLQLVVVLWITLRKYFYPFLINNKSKPFFKNRYFLGLSTT